MFGLLGNAISQLSQMKYAADEMRHRRQMNEWRSARQDQMAEDEFMRKSGAKTIIIKPDGTMVPIYD